VAAGVLAYSLILVVALLVSQALAPGVAEPAVFDGMVAQGVGFAAALLFARFVPPATPWLGRRRIGSSILIYVGFLFGWAPFSLIAVPWFWLHMGWPLSPQPHLQWFVEAAEGPQLAVMLAIVCGLGPIVEEVVFRGYLQRGLEQWLGPSASLWIVSLFFGLVHVGSGWHLFLPLALMGLLFGFLRNRSNGLAAPIVVHMLHNTLTVSVTMLFPDALEAVRVR
jgi:membrane protease YdiL (CAAX protease family)